MKTKMKTIKLLCISLAFILISTVALCLLLNKNNSYQVFADATIEQFEIADEIGVGEVLEVSKDVVLRVDENTTVKPTKSTLKYPNGVVRELMSQVLTEKGQYVIEFYGKNGNVDVKAEKEFYVKDDIYVLSEPLLDKAQYKTADTIKNGDLMGVDGSKKSAGIEVSVGQNEYFRYNSPVNLYDLPIDENGRTDICNFYPVMGYYMGENWQVISRLATVKLIDCYDESNYVEFYMCDRLLFNEGIFYCGGASYQNLTGLFVNATGETTYDGNTYHLFSYSTRYAHDSYGADAGIKGIFGSSGVYSKGGFNLEYDLDEQKIFINNTLVTDLDSEIIYPNNTFKGFTTGEVYVQFEFPRCLESVEFQITSLFDMQGEKLKNGFVKDKTGPKVNIDLELNGKDYINITTGKEFVFPDAEVFDVYGVRELKKAVYADYFTDEPKIIYSDGESFIPSKNSTYTIVYMATDMNGNRNVDANGKCLDYLTVNSISDDIISYDKENKITTLSAASVNYIPYLPATSSNGEVSISVYVVDDKGNEEEITYTLKDNSYTYIPKDICEYEIKYVFNDGIFNEVFSYKLVASDVGAVLFNDKIQLPSVLIKNAIYDIEPYYSYVASQDGLVSKACEIWFRNDGIGDFTKITDVSKYEVTASSTVEFKVKYGEVWSDFTQKCQIVDVNITEAGGAGKSYQNYFHGYDSVSLTNKSIDYKLNAGENKKLTYATPIARDVFAFEFTLKGTGISEFSVQLKEVSAKDNVGYEITYTYVSNKTYYYKVTSLDGLTLYLNKLITGDYYGKHLLQVSSGTLSAENGSTVKLADTNNKYIEFSFNSKKVSFATEICVSMVCNTIFNLNIYELPLQVCLNRPIGTYVLGMTYTVPEFYVSSPFYPVSSSNLTYTLASKDSGIRKDVNGNLLQNINCDDGKTYSFVCDKAEKYDFTFKYDNYGRGYLSVKNTYAILISDNVAPVIKFTDDSDSETVVEVDVGETVIIKEYTVTDNIPNEEVIVNIFVTSESGLVLAWKIRESEGYVFNTAGRYRYCVYAVDTAGNYSTAYYIVEVA